MFRLIFIFVILGLGLFVGTLFSDQQGYVLISIANTTTEMSVTTLVIFVIATLAALFLLENLIKRGLRATSATWNWFSVRKLKRARRYTNEGMIKLLEGNWSVAEKKVTRWANHHDMPTLCYLIASEAAQGMNDNSKRIKYLELARQTNEHKLAVELTNIRQLIRNNQFSEANEALEPLRGSHPNNSIILNLLKKTYLSLELWGALSELLPKLSQLKVISADEHQQLLHQVQAGKITEIGEQQSVKGLLSYWDQLPKKLKTDEFVIEKLVQEVLKYQGDQEAYLILRDTLNKTHSEHLVPLFKQVQINDLNSAIQLLEKVNKKHRSSPETQSTLGYLYLNNQQYQEAQTVLEQALHQRAHIGDYSLLAEALELQGKEKAAGEVSRTALKLVEKTV